MIGVKKDRHNIRSVTRQFRTQGDKVEVGLILLSAGFLIFGSFVGCVVSSYSPALNVGEFLPGVSVNEIEIFSIVHTFLSCAKYPLLVLLFAGSVYGSFVIPFLCAFRGYLLSCAVASLSSVGRLYSLVVVGLPALFTVPCFFLLCSDSFVLSRRLISFGTCGWLSPRLDLPILFHCIFSAGLLMIATLVQLLLVPKFASLLV